MEAEFASWQAKVGPDFTALESALKPVERHVKQILFFVHLSSQTSFSLFYYAEISFLHFFYFFINDVNIFVFRRLSTDLL